jgi:hypothetical protein
MAQRGRILLLPSAMTHNYLSGKIGTADITHAAASAAPAAFVLG